MRSEPLDFYARTQIQEWMDEPCSYEDFHACLADLAKVNRWTFACRPTLQWLRGIARRGESPLHIVDIGSGGGDVLRKIEIWARREKIAVRLTGIDLNPYATCAARQFSPVDSQITWLTGDAYHYQPPVTIDIVISSLFTHHLGDKEIVRFLTWMEGVATRGWFINDLHRARMSYHAFRLLAGIARWHRFVQHDGPVSIRRAFSREDWLRYCTRAGLLPPDLRVEHFRPGRLCLSRVKI